MPLPSSINDLSTTAGSNSPAGSESPSLIDDYLRTYASYIAQLRDAAQSNGFTYAAAGGSANAITATYTPAITTLSDSTVLLLKAASPNTGATTFSPNGLTAKPIVDLSHTALQGGEIVANGDVCLQYNTSVGGGSWVLIYSSGVTVQTPVIAGSVRNLKMSVTTASASATLTADEIIVKTALGSYAKVLSSFSKTINLATTGAGGMDTGSAPASGFVSIYAIYNPTTSTAALLACNQTTSSGPVYTGANMPSGYTASALVSAWGTTASSQLAIGMQVERQINVALTTINTSTVNQSNSSINMSAIVPTAAKEIGGLMQVGSTAASYSSMALSGTAGAVGSRNVGGQIVASSAVLGSFSGLSLVTPATCFYSANASAGALSSTAYLTSYTI